MGESTSQIERDIAAERNELGRNLQLLEHKARSLTDWRTYYRNHPFAMMAVALGGGVLLGALTSGMAGGAPAASDFDDDSLFEPPEDSRLFESVRVCGIGRARPSSVRRHLGSHCGGAPGRGVGKGDSIRRARKCLGSASEFAAKHPEHRGVFSTGRSV